MNTRFNLILLQYLNPRKLNRHKDKGFALPIALVLTGIGLVIAVTMVIRAQGSQSQVVAQADKSKSLAAAEAGLTRVQNLLNDVRFIALYSNSDWSTAVDSTGAPTNTTMGRDVGSYITAAAASTSCSGNTTTTAADIQTKLATLRTWVASSSNSINLDPGDLSKGQFRLVSYNPGGASGVMPNGTQTGTLIIEGRSGGAGANGASRLRVNIPVTASTASVSDTSPAPGLWIRKGGVNDTNQIYETSSTALDNNGAKFDAHVWFNDCDNTLSDSYVSSVQTNRILNSRTATKTTVPFPALPTRPDLIPGLNLISLDSTKTGSGGGNTINIPNLTTAPVDTSTNGVYNYLTSNSLQCDAPKGNGKRIKCTVGGTGSGANNSVTLVLGDNSGATKINFFNNLGTVNSTLALPRSTDVISSDDVYRYWVTSIDMSGNQSLTITPGEKVEFYVQGNILVTGTGDIVHNCSNGSGGTVAGCTPSNFQIFAYNTNSSNSGQICLKGSSRTDGYILAPDYELGKTGQGAWFGSLFGKSWGKIQNCGSSNGNTAVTQTGTWATIPSVFRPRSLPRLGQFSGYQQQAVQ